MFLVIVGLYWRKGTFLGTSYDIIERPDFIPYSGKNKKSTFFPQNGLNYFYEIKIVTGYHENRTKNRGHPDLNQGPLDLQSNALPLSYIPML